MAAVIAMAYKSVGDNAVALVSLGVQMASATSTHSAATRSPVRFCPFFGKPDILNKDCSVCRAIGHRDRYDWGIIPPTDNIIRDSKNAISDCRMRIPEYEANIIRCHAAMRQRETYLRQVGIENHHDTT